MKGASPKKFLVVDDEPAVRLLVFTILSEAGYTVDLAGNGSHALQMMSRGGPPGRPCYDLIISDINMPEMDGITFYRALAEKLPEFKKRVLFMTGGLTNGALSFFQEHGCRYILKTFEEADLLEEIHDMLDK